MGGAANEVAAQAAHRRRGLADGDSLGVLRQAQFPDLQELRFEPRTSVRGFPVATVDGRGAARTGETRPSPFGGARYSAGAVDVEPRRVASARAFQQIERAELGADDGIVRDAGGLFGSRILADGGRKLLH